MDAEHALRILEGKQRHELARYQVDSNRATEAANAANKAGSDAIRSVTLLNGGAAVAMLAFMGHLASTGALVASTALVGPLTVFGSGTAAALLASGFTFFGQGRWLRRLEHQFDIRRLEQADEELLERGGNAVNTEAIKKAKTRERRAKKGGNAMYWCAVLCGLQR